VQEEQWTSGSFAPDEQRRLSNVDDRRFEITEHSDLHQVVICAGTLHAAMIATPDSNNGPQRK
jgi:hypothetical protein